jgi:hypothetical protein
MSSDEATLDDDMATVEEQNAPEAKKKYNS